jgi:tetratricopeptide (TPR) repeat protein
MRKYLLIIIAGLLGVSAAHAQRYYDLVEKADKAIAESKWEEARDNIVQAISLNPENPSNILLQSNLGIVYYNLGADSLAIATLNEAHARAPKSVTVLLNRADILTAMRREPEAYKDYGLVIELDSTLVQPRYMHAILSLQCDKPEVTLRDCKKLEEMSPGSRETHLAYASYYSTSEQWEKALQHYTALLEKEPSADLYAARAVCYLMLQRLNEASADITSGLELEPENSELYLYRAYLNKMRYMPEDARKDLRHALKLNKK